MISAMVVKGLQRSTQWVAEWVVRVAEIYTSVGCRMGSKVPFNRIFGGDRPSIGNCASLGIRRVTIFGPGYSSLVSFSCNVTCNLT